MAIKLRHETQALRRHYGDLAFKKDALNNPEIRGFYTGYAGKEAGVFEKKVLQLTGQWGAYQKGVEIGDEERRAKDVLAELVLGEHFDGTVISGTISNFIKEKGYPGVIPIDEPS